jgi:type I restriction enzyme S subunit
MSGAAPTAKLAEVAELNPPLADSLGAGDEVSFLPMSAVDAESVTAVDRETRLYSEVSKGYTPFLEGDVLVAKITPCFENGKIAQVHLTRRYGFGSTEFHVVRPHSNRVNARYLVHFLRQERIRLQGEARMTGSAGQRRVPENFLAGLSVPLPPLPEQRRIAEILDKADALRAKRRAALAQLDTLTQSIFLDMFGDPATNPKGWPVVSVGDICEVKGGKRLPKGEEYSSAPTPFRYIRVVDLKGGRIDESALVYLKPDIQAEIARYVVNAGDVIISIAGSIGLVAAVPASLNGVNLTENAAKLVPRMPGQYEPAYLAEYLRTEHAQGEIGSHVGQVTIGKLALFRIEKLKVPLPPRELQREFVQRMAVVNAQASTQLEARSLLDALFGSLQHRAFQGEL